MRGVVVGSSMGEILLFAAQALKTHNEVLLVDNTGTVLRIIERRGCWRGGSFREDQPGCELVERQVQLHWHDG